MKSSVHRSLIGTNGVFANDVSHCNNGGTEMIRTSDLAFRKRLIGAGYRTEYKQYIKEELYLCGVIAAKITHCNDNRAVSPTVQISGPPTYRLQGVVKALSFNSNSVIVRGRNIHP